MTNWNATEAKLHFAELLKSACKEPQTIYRRGTPVSVMMPYNEFANTLALQQQKSTAAWLQELRDICADEADMEEIPRTDRKMPEWDAR